MSVSLSLLASCLGLMSSSDEARLGELAEGFLEKKPAMAVSVGVIQSGKRWTFAVGSLPDGDPDADTLYEIGSITKTMTGTLLAGSVLRGTVRLDEPLQDRLPQSVVLPKRDGREISLLHVATHTSSLPVQPPWLPLTAIASGTETNPYSKFDFKQLAKSLRNMTLPRPIGARFEYSNLGVGLLGHALASAESAEGYEELLRARVLDPLGMSSTAIRLSPELEPRMAQGHNLLGLRASNWDFACLEACGGVRSSANDMLRFAAASMADEETDLSRAFQFAKQPWRFNDRRGNDCIGLCWLLKRDKSIAGDVWWHNGGTGGFRSYLGTIPTRGIAVVILSNSAHPVDGLAKDMLRVLSPGEDK